jgi:3-(methylthio)propanoyl-CoA dehydrogenase
LSTYIAPLDEIRFVLNDLINISKLSEQIGSDVLADAELVDAILEQAARFAEQVLAPLNTVGDRHGAKWKDGQVSTAPGFIGAYNKFVESGWNNVVIAEKNGGQGLPNLLCAALQEMFVSANKSFCFCPELTAFAVKALENAASEELKQQYIPNLVSGKWTATMNLTEPQAGSDVGALRTRAMLQEDGSYRIFGQKIFISYGEHDLAENIIHLVLARIPGAPEGSRGVSLFVVPKILPESGIRNDVVCTGVEHKMGNHGSPTCTLVYGDSGEGATGWLVGELNMGLKAMFVMVNSARFNVGLEGVALGELAYQQAKSYAQERIQGRLATGGSDSVTIIRHPDVRRMLLVMRSQTEAMRALAYTIAATRDRTASCIDQIEKRSHQSFVDLMIPIFKGWASETAIDVTSTSIQVHGGIGYIEESGVSQPFRDVRVAAIYEGTTSIQAHDLVERKLVNNGGKAYQAWRYQIEICLTELAQRDDPTLLTIHHHLQSAVTAMDSAVTWAIENYAEYKLEVLAGSVPLLRLCGMVAGGWLLARSATVAKTQLLNAPYASGFLPRKVQSAHFYACHVLPEVNSLAMVAKGVGMATLALGEEAF